MSCRERTWHRALEGERVVVTRAVHQAAGLIAALEAEGARVEALPMIEVFWADAPELEAVVAEPRQFDWVTFTSANAVESLLRRLDDPRLLPPAAVVGPATAEALRARGIEPALEAGQRDAVGLARALAETAEPGSRILAPQADDARPELVEGLVAAGFEVSAPTTYGKRLPAGSHGRMVELFAEAPIGWVTFTSPRIVRHFLEGLEALPGVGWQQRRGELKAASIGPTTSAALRRHGIEPAAEARPPGVPALVEAMVSTAS